MSNPFVGEIRIFAGNFAPNGWAFCDGRLLAISEQETLFNLIGTTYGGDGQSNFALPDLRGRAPVHQGQGPGLSNYTQGQTGGQETVTVTTQQMPAHGHSFLASTSGGSSSNPQNNVIGSPPSVTLFIEDVPALALTPQVVTQTGGSQPHENRMPYITINYIISLFGVFPSQS